MADAANKGATETGDEGKEGSRTVLIAMDGSKHAIYAFECKLLHILFRSV